MALLPDEQWDTVIEPKSKWFDLKLKETWRYRDLIALFVRRDFVSVYKQTILGPIWHIIQPIFTTLIYLVVFGRIAQIPTDGMPPILFYLSGTTIWNFFSRALTLTSSTFVSNAGIFGKVYFPRIVIPISNVISGLIAFLIQFGILTLVATFYIASGQYSFNLNANFLWLFWLVTLMALLGLGLGIIVSSLTTRYRDLSHLLGFGVQLLMYVSPVVYPLSFVPAKVLKILQLNPLSGIIENFRAATISGAQIDLQAMIYSSVFTFIVLMVGLVMFNRVERNFMDTV